MCICHNKIRLRKWHLLVEKKKQRVNRSGTPMGSIFPSIFKNTHKKRSLLKVCIYVVVSSVASMITPRIKGIDPPQKCRFRTLAIHYRPKLTWS